MTHDRGIIETLENQESVDGVTPYQWLQEFVGFSWNDILDAFQKYAPSQKEDEQEALPATTNGNGLVNVNGNGNAIDINMTYEPGLDDGKLVSTYPSEEHEEEIPW